MKKQIRTRQTFQYGYLSTSCMFFIMVNTQKPFINQNMDHVILDFPFLRAYTRTLSSAGQQVRAQEDAPVRSSRIQAGSCRANAAQCRSSPRRDAPLWFHALPAADRRIRCLITHQGRPGARRGQRNACGHRCSTPPTAGIRGGIMPSSREGQACAADPSCPPPRPLSPSHCHL